MNAQLQAVVAEIRPVSRRRYDLPRLHGAPDLAAADGHIGRCVVCGSLTYRETCWTPHAAYVGAP